MTVRLIVIDLDETLLKRDKTYDVERFNHVLSELKNRGVIVCIATGNSYHKIIDYFSVEDQKDLYFACDNGNFIIKNDEVLASKKVSSKTLHDISEFMDEFEGFNILVNTGHHAYFRENQGPIYETIAKYNNVLGYVETFEDIPEGEQPTKLAIHSVHSLDRNKTMSRIIRERYEDVTAVTSGDGWLDIYHVDGGKGSAVKKLQEKYQITKEESMAFGDSLNDESMMEVVKYSMAMGNSDRDLLLSTKYQIGTNEEQAVIKVLEELVESESDDFLDKYLTHKK